MVWSAVQSVVSLLILIAIGFWITGQKWFSEYGPGILSKFTVKVAIPCYMVYNVLDTCQTPERLLQLMKSLPIPFFTILLSLGLGSILVRVFRVDKTRRGVFLNAVTFSNTVIIGFPVVESLFGEEGLPQAMIYYMANTILFWTIGTYLLRSDGPQKSKLISWNGIKKIFSPPIIGFLIGVVLVLLRIELPEFIMDPLTMMKQTTTPIAMIFIGSVMRQTDLKSAHLEKELWSVLAVRFVLSPIVMVFICRLLPIDPFMEQIFFILSTMPAMTQLGIMAKESESDYHFAAVLVAVTSAVSMVTIPIYMFLISQFHILG